MATISAGVNTSIPLAAGNTLVFDASGSGLAVIANGQEAGQAYTVGQSQVAIGPFKTSRNISVSAQTALTYGISPQPVAGGAPLYASGPTDASAATSLTLQALANNGVVPGGRGVFNLNATNSKYWQIARAKVRSKQARARVGVVGTSLKVGQGSNPATPANATNAQVLGPVNQVAQLLSAMGTPSVNSSAFGDGGAARYSQTLPVQDPRFTFGANWASTFNNNQIWPGGSAIVYTTGAANNLSFAPVEQTDRARVWYYSFASNGTFNTNVNGGASLGTTNTATNPQQILASADFTFARGVNVLNIVPGNNGNLTILGVEMWDSTVPAVNFLNFSLRGGAIADHTFFNRNTVPGITLPTLNAYGPIDLWYVSLTVNDVNQAGNWSTPTEYRARLETLVTYLLSSGASDVWLGIDPPSNTAFSTNGTLAVYVAIVYEIAAKFGLPVLDMVNRWGSYANNSQYYVPDGVHITAPGYADGVSMEAAALTEPV